MVAKYLIEAYIVSKKQNDDDDENYSGGVWINWDSFDPK